MNNKIVNFDAVKKSLVLILISKNIGISIASKQQQNMAILLVENNMRHKLSNTSTNSTKIFFLALDISLLAIIKLIEKTMLVINIRIIENGENKKYLDKI